MAWRLDGTIAIRRRATSTMLTDGRGGRTGFPADVREELHRLKTFYEALNPAPDDVWRSST